MSVPLLCSSQNLVKTRAVPESEGEPKLARRFAVLGSARIATRRPDGSNSDFPPPVQSQGASSSSRARTLFWPYQSPPLAETNSSGSVRTLLRNVLPRKRLRVSLPVHRPVRPSILQTTPPRADEVSTKSPCSIVQRARSRARTQGPQGCPCPTLSAWASLYRGPAF